MAQRTISKHYHGIRNILPDVDKIKELLIKELERSVSKDESEVEKDEREFDDIN